MDYSGKCSKITSKNDPGFKLNRNITMISEESLNLVNKK